MAGTYRPEESLRLYRLRLGAIRDHLQNHELMLDRTPAERVLGAAIAAKFALIDFEMAVLDERLARLDATREGRALAVVPDCGGDYAGHDPALDGKGRDEDDGLAGLAAASVPGGVHGHGDC